MPRTRRCDFCEDDIEPGTGTMFVRTDGTTIHFCSSKCESNADLGREARDLEWAGEEEEDEAEGTDAEETEPEETQADEEDSEDSDAAETEAEEDETEDADVEADSAADDDDEDGEETEAEA